MKRELLFGETPDYTWEAAVVRYFEENGEVPNRKRRASADPESSPIKPSVLKRYRVSLRAVDPFLRGRTMSQIDAKLIADMVGGRKKGGRRVQAGTNPRGEGRAITNRTIRNDLTAVSQVLAHCCGWGWRFDNPALSFDRRTMLKAKQRRIVLPSDEDIAFAKASMPPTLAALVDFYRFTGCRAEEGATLEWSDITTKGGAQMLLTRTKTDRPRAVPLDDLVTREAQAVLAALPRHLKSQWVFWHDKGRTAGDRYRKLSQRVNELMRVIGEKAAAEGRPFQRFTLHKLRHRFCVDYLKAGGNIYILQQIAGHSSVKVTERYLAYMTPAERQHAMMGQRGPIPARNVG